MAHDLTIMTGVTCQTNIEWSTTVGEYTVRFGKLFGRNFHIQGVLNGYTCTCKGFVFRGGGMQAHRVRPWPAVWLEPRC